MLDKDLALVGVVFFGRQVEQHLPQVGRRQRRRGRR